MPLIEAVIDIIIILLLIRLLIRPNEARFNGIFSLIFRITDPLLKPAFSLIRNDFKAIILSVFVLVLIRGALYMPVKSVSIIAGAGLSFLNLFRLLFQFYMAIWIISILSKESYGNALINMAQRAFLPLSAFSSRIGIPQRHFSFFSFMALWIIYSIIAYLLYHIILYGAVLSGVSIIHAFGEGLLLIIGLFPGFFSIVIIIGALLSWVSPDPYNPVVQAIYGISEPLLAPFRRLIPNLGGIDISPIIALICFQFAGRFMQQLIASILKTI